MGYSHILNTAPTVTKNFTQPLVTYQFPTPYFSALYSSGILEQVFDQSLLIIPSPLIQTLSLAYQFRPKMWFGDAR